MHGPWPWMRAPRRALERRPVRNYEQTFGPVRRPGQELLGEQRGYGFAGFSVSTAVGNYTQCG